MPADLARPPLVDQPLLRDFLEAKGFRRTAPDAFGNGRATLRFTGTNLLAIPAGGGRAWRSELNETPPEAIRNALEAFLSTPSFRAAAELQRREDRCQAAEASLAVLTDAIAKHTDTHSGVHLRRFLWSLYNGHHALNFEPLAGEGRPRPSTTATTPPWSRSSPPGCRDMSRRTPCATP